MATVGEPGTATVVSRIENLTDGQFVGQTVSDIRSNFGSVLGIADAALPLVKNTSHGEDEFREVSPDYEVQEGDILSFNLPVGSKG